MCKLYLYLYLYIISDPCALPADNEVNLHTRIKSFPTFRRTLSRPATSPPSSQRLLRPPLSNFGSHHAIIIRHNISCSRIDSPSSFEGINPASATVCAIETTTMGSNP
jgi:hypothetical protein